MSLQDKIASAKPSTFLTDGLSEEEVKQAVDEGRKSVTDTVKLIIEIPKVPKNDHERWVLAHGTPLEDVKKEIHKKSVWIHGFNYVAPYKIDEILDNIGKAESEDKE